MVTQISIQCMHMCPGQRSQVCWPVAGSHLEYSNEDQITMATVISRWFKPKMYIHCYEFKWWLNSHLCVCMCNFLPWNITTLSTFTKYHMWLKRTGLWEAPYIVHSTITAWWDLICPVVYSICILLAPLYLYLSGSKLHQVILYIGNYNLPSTQPHYLPPLYRWVLVLP